MRALGGPVISHPGKCGDCLLSMPVVKTLAEAIGPAVIVTSQMCAPVATLLHTLPYVRGVVVLTDAEYRVEHTHFGAQPWLMPVLVEQPFDAVFHLGFRHFPHAGQLVTHLAGEPYGITPAPGPWLPPIKVNPDGPVAVPAATRADYAWMIQQVADQGRMIRLFGTAEELRAFPVNAWNNLNINGSGDSLFEVRNFLDIHTILDGCSTFVGVNSGPSIVAMGGGLPVVWPHRPGVEQERWAHHGCDVKTIDPDGTIRVLRSP